jgi:hypothetical protein
MKQTKKTYADYVSEKAHAKLVELHKQFLQVKQSHQDLYKYLMQTLEGDKKISAYNKGLTKIFCLDPLSEFEQKYRELFNCYELNPDYKEKVKESLRNEHLKADEDKKPAQLAKIEQIDKCLEKLNSIKAHPIIAFEEIFPLLAFDDVINATTDWKSHYQNYREHKTAVGYILSQLEKYVDGRTAPYVKPRATNKKFYPHDVVNDNRYNYRKVKIVEAAIFLFEKYAEYGIFSEEIQEMTAQTAAQTHAEAAQSTNGGEGDPKQKEYLEQIPDDYIHILKELAKHKDTKLQSELVNILGYDAKTLRKWLDDMQSRGLVLLEFGERKGYSITEKGYKYTS